MGKKSVTPEPISNLFPLEMCIDFSQSVHYLLPYCVINKMYMLCYRMPLQPGVKINRYVIDGSPLLMYCFNHFLPPPLPVGKTQMKLTWSLPVKPTPAALRWWFLSMRRDWHGIPVQRMKSSSVSSGPGSLLHYLCPLPQDWFFSSGMPSSFSQLSYFFRRSFHPRFVWQSRRAMLLYIFAPLFVREQVYGVVIFFFSGKLDHSLSSFYDICDNSLESTLLIERDTTY